MEADYDEVCIAAARSLRLTLYPFRSASICELLQLTLLRSPLSHIRDQVRVPTPHPSQHSLSILHKSFYGRETNM
jgi:hypothetical protein